MQEVQKVQEGQELEGAVLQAQSEAGKGGSDGVASG